MPLVYKRELSICLSVGACLMLIGPISELYMTYEQNRE